MGAPTYQSDCNCNGIEAAEGEEGSGIPRGGRNFLGCQIGKISNVGRSKSSPATHYRHPFDLVPFFLYWIRSVTCSLGEILAEEAQKHPEIPCFDTDDVQVWNVVLDIHTPALTMNQGMIAYIRAKGKIRQ